MSQNPDHTNKKDPQPNNPTPKQKTKPDQTALPVIDDEIPF